jgi:uncharacterized membrane protein AbrB (regulator of aidB expression)
VIVYLNCVYIYIRAYNWHSNISVAVMGLTISSVFTRLFGKKQMRILMGKYVFVMISVELAGHCGCILPRV